MKILILGGNGMIGHKMYQVISKKYPNTWVLFKKKYDSVQNNLLFKKDFVIDDFDVSDFSKLIQLLNHLKVDIIINAIGLTIRRNVYDIHSKSILINSVLPHILNEWVISNNKRLIHFSTDCVFSGKDGFYTEDSFVDSIDFYGRTKGLGEIISSNTLTLRSSMIGLELENKTELLEWFLSNKNGVVQGYNRAIYSGITTNCMANFVEKIIEHYPNINGLYNVSSEKITKFDLLNLFNDYFQTNINIVPNNLYVTNKVLNSDKFYKITGFKKPDWENLIKDLVNDSKEHKQIYQ
jgi:dTDP-4-dehydrorhamnose reductase